MMDEKQFQKARQGLCVINCARASLINQKALLKFVKNGKISKVFLKRKSVLGLRLKNNFLDMALSAGGSLKSCKALNGIDNYYIFNHFHIL